MFDIRTFYLTYQVNYYDFIQLTLNEALGNSDNFKYQDAILNYDHEDYRRAIKSLIRQTYFQAIETVFDLVFALCPDAKGGINDALILRRLSKPEFHQKKINEIANSNKGLNFLDQIVELGRKVIPLDHYIFYFGIYNEDKKQQITQSLKSIRIGLKELARDFSDTKEYNSFKHGLRIIPAIKNFILAKAENRKQIVNWDLQDSLTYYVEDFKTKEIEFVTKKFDTIRDLRMTSFCSNLIWNIIEIRACAFYKNDRKSVKTLFFGNDYIKDISKVNIDLQTLRFTLTPKNKR